MSYRLPFLSILLAACLALPAAAEAAAKSAATKPAAKSVRVTMLSPTMEPGNMVKNLAKLLPHFTPYKFTVLQSKKDAKAFILKFDIDYSKERLPRLTVLVDCFLQTYDKKRKIALVNLVCVRGLPNVAPLSGGDKEKFGEFVTGWQQSHGIPQGVYLDPNGKIVLGWDLPVTAVAPVFPGQVGYVINAMAGSWSEMAPAMQKAGLIK